MDCFVSVHSVERILSPSLTGLLEWTQRTLHQNLHMQRDITGSLEDVYLTGCACYDHAKYRYASSTGEFLEHVGACSETGFSRLECAVSHISRLSSL